MIDTAKENNIKHQVDIVSGGMTDGAVIYMNRSGILTAILSLATRYLHAATSVFDIKNIQLSRALMLFPLWFSVPSSPYSYRIVMQDCCLPKRSG